MIIWAFTEPFGNIVIGSEVDNDYIREMHPGAGFIRLMMSKRGDIIIPIHQVSAYRKAEEEVDDDDLPF